jgi:hypothetical protein
VVGTGRNPLALMIRLPKESLHLTERLLVTPVPGRRGPVELGNLLRVSEEPASPTIFRCNGRPAEMVMAELAGAYEAPVYGMLAVADALRAMPGAPEIRLGGGDDREDARGVLGAGGSGRSQGGAGEQGEGGGSEGRTGHREAPWGLATPRRGRVCRGGGCPGPPRRRRHRGVGWLVETHVHADHLSAAPYMQQHLGGKIGIGEQITVVQEVFGKVFSEGTEFRRDGSQFDRLFKDGDSYMIGGLRAVALHTPGHTPACMTHVIGDAAFVGDTLFMPDGGSARADFPGGEPDKNAVILDGCRVVKYRALAVVPG